MDHSETLIPEHRRDPLVEVEDARLVEEHLAAVGDDLLDHLVHGVVEGRRPLAAVGEQRSPVRGEVRGIFEVGLDQEDLAPASRTRPARPGSIPDAWRLMLTASFRRTSAGSASGSTPP